MTIKVILPYLVGFFAGALGAYMAVKRLVGRFASAGIKPLIYSLVYGVVIALLLFGATYLLQKQFALYWVFFAIILIAAIIHVRLTHRKYFELRDDFSAKIVSGEFLFALDIVLLSALGFMALMYFLKDKTFLFYPTVCATIAFFIPLLFIHTFGSAMRIPYKIQSTWKYPSMMLEPPEEKPNERLLVIGFMLSKKNEDKVKTYFRAKTPEDIQLGELFYHFINDYNELQSETPIQYTDDYNEPLQWWFYRKPRWYQFKRMLNPYDTMRNNGIKENSIIVCERIFNESV